MQKSHPLRPYKAQIMLGFIIGLIALAAGCFGQVVCEGKAKAQVIVNMPGKKADEVFKQAARVASLHLSTVNTVANELVSGEGLKRDGAVLSKFPAVIGNLSYRCIFDVKDEKVRVTITDMVVIFPSERFTAEKYLCKHDNSLRTNSQAKALTESIQNLLQSIVDSFNEKSDW